MGCSAWVCTGAALPPALASCRLRRPERAAVDHPPVECSTSAVGGRVGCRSGQPHVDAATRLAGLHHYGRAWGDLLVAQLPTHTAAQLTPRSLCVCRGRAAAGPGRAPVAHGLVQRSVPLRSRSGLLMRLCCTSRCACAACPPLHAEFRVEAVQQTAHCSQDSICSYVTLAATNPPAPGHSPVATLQACPSCWLEQRAAQPAQCSSTHRTQQPMGTAQKCQRQPTFGSCSSMWQMSALARTM